jgi:O-antigen/teichoic acid export membrane protein
MVFWQRTSLTSLRNSMGSPEMLDAAGPGPELQSKSADGAQPVPRPVEQALSTVAPLRWLRRASHFIARLRATGDRGRSQGDAVQAFTIRVGSAGLLYLSQIALARWMGATDYGMYVLAWTCVLVLGGLSHVGLSMVMMRQLPAYAETGNTEQARGLLLGGRLLALGLGSLVAFVVGMLVWWYEAAIDQARLWPMYLALACVPLYALSDVQDGIGRGRGWIGAALVPVYILRPALLLTGIAIAHAAGLKTTAATAVMAAILATALSAGIQYLWLRSKLAAEFPPGPRAYAFGTWMRIGAPLLAIYGAELTLQNADVLLLSLWRPAAEVGMYFAAAKTMALVMFVHYAVGSAFAHRFSALAAKGDQNGLAEAVQDAVRWTFWPSLAAAGILLLAGRPVLALFSPAFVEAFPVMAVLVIGFLARAAYGPAEMLLNMLGEQRRCAIVVVTAAALSIGLQLLLIPQFGLLGAATATAIALVVQAQLAVKVARERLGIDLSLRTRLR